MTSPFTVTHLAFWDQGNDGLVDAHQVGIWSSTDQLLSSGTVAAGTAGVLSGQTGYFGGNFAGNVVATPEPASIGLLATGLIGVFGVVRRRRNANAA